MTQTAAKISVCVFKHNTFCWVFWVHISKLWRCMSVMHTKTWMHCFIAFVSYPCPFLFFVFRFFMENTHKTKEKKTNKQCVRPILICPDRAYDFRQISLTFLSFSVYFSAITFWETINFTVGCIVTILFANFAFYFLFFGFFIFFFF